MKSFNIRPEKTTICTMIGYDNPDITIAEGRYAESEGAHSLLLGIERLRPEFRNKEQFKLIADSFMLPLMGHYYRGDRWSETPADDDARAAVLLEAAEAGFAMIDVMGDQFDNSPDERTRNPEAIAKQKDLIAKIHDCGAKVIMSSHPVRYMTKDEVVEQLKDFESRGADVVKIVTTTNTEDEFAETIRTTMALNHELGVPFVYLSSGRFGPAHRIAGLSLGVAISFTLTSYDGWRWHSASNPLTRNARAVQDNTIWHLNALP